MNNNMNNEIRSALSLRTDTQWLIWLKPKWNQRNAKRKLFNITCCKQLKKGEFAIRSADKWIFAQSFEASHMFLQAHCTTRLHSGRPLLESSLFQTRWTIRILLLTAPKSLIRKCNYTFVCYRLRINAVYRVSSSSLHESHLNIVALSFFLRLVFVSFCSLAEHAGPSRTLFCSSTLTHSRLTRAHTHTRTHFVMRLQQTDTSMEQRRTPKCIV